MSAWLTSPVYSPEWEERYIQWQQSLGRICFAIMTGNEIAGELILKNIERKPNSCFVITILRGKP